MKRKLLLALLLVATATPLLALNWYQINRYFGLMVFPPKEVTIADDGAGTSPAETLTTPERRAYKYTCSDTDGCTLTLGETNVFDGQWLTIYNVGSNAITLSDSSGVQELNATYAMAQYEYLTLEYQADRWVEVSRSAAGTGVATSGDSATAFFSSGTIEQARLPANVSARAELDGAAAIGTGAWTAIPFDGTDIWDTNAIHDPVTENTKLTVPVGYGGKWRIECGVSWLASSSGNQRGIAIRVNGATFISLNKPVAQQHATNSSELSTSATYILAAGEYAECMGYQDTGSNLNANDTAYTYGAAFFEGS